MPLSLLNHSALALFAQRTRIPTSARSIGFCAIWVCISSSSQFRWRDDKNSDQLWSSRTNTWGSSKVIRYLPLLSAFRSHLWRSTQERDGNEISR